MTDAEQQTSREPLERARRADERMWRAKEGRLALRAERDQTLRDAVADGWSAQDVARAVNLPVHMVQAVVDEQVPAPDDRLSEPGTAHRSIDLTVPDGAVPAVLGADPA